MKDPTAEMVADRRWYRINGTRYDRILSEIERGDDLGAIAKRHGTTKAVIAVYRKALTGSCTIIEQPINVNGDFGGYRLKCSSRELCKWLHEHSGMRVPKIAETLGVNTGTLMNRVYLYGQMSSKYTDMIRDRLGLDLIRAGLLDGELAPRGGGKYGKHRKRTANERAGKAGRGHHGAEGGEQLAEEEAEGSGDATQRECREDPVRPAAVAAGKAARRQAGKVPQRLQDAQDRAGLRRRDRRDVLAHGDHRHVPDQVKEVRGMEEDVEIVAKGPASTESLDAAIARLNATIERLTQTLKALEEGRNAMTEFLK